MATTTGFGYPMMDTIRSVIAQIDRALLPYATKRTFSVKTLPPNLLLYCQERSSSATLMALRRYRVTLQDQLLELVIASRDQAVLASHLQWARKTMSEIETFYFSYHYESPNPAAPPMDLVSCIYDNFTDTAVSLQKRTTIEQIDMALIPYATNTSTGEFCFKHLPPNLRCYCSGDSNSDILHSLRKWRETLDEQMFELVLASKDRALVDSYLRHIKLVTAGIETLRSVGGELQEGGPQFAIPSSLASCIYDSDEDTISALHKRFISLKNQEFRLSLEDMKNPFPFEGRVLTMEESFGASSVNMRGVSTSACGLSAELPPYEFQASAFR
ncbi:hypothetical protein BG003_003128 [Podila horticola]|nr:hypothetical protein BG003_003128 [Podila horticola]